MAPRFAMFRGGELTTERVEVLFGRRTGRGFDAAGIGTEVASGAGERS
jgi:hypothetical protein